MYQDIFMSRIVANLMVRRCIILSPSHILDICRDLNGDISLSLFFAECNFSDLVVSN